jgi:hypothetical protein
LVTAAKRAAPATAAASSSSHPGGPARAGHVNRNRGAPPPSWLSSSHRDGRAWNCGTTKMTPAWTVSSRHPPFTLLYRVFRYLTRSIGSSSSLSSQKVVKLRSDPNMDGTATTWSEFMGDGCADRRGLPICKSTYATGGVEGGGGAR